MQYNSEFYKKRVAEKLSTSDNPENDAVVAKALRALDASPGKRILDFGCGDGYFTERLAGESGADLHGIDVVSYPQWTRRQFAEFTVGSVPIPFDDETFDGIFCSQVYEHVPDTGAVAAEFARVLKPGGRIWIATPNSYEHTWPIFHALQHEIDRVEGHYRHFSADDINAEFAPLGLRVAMVRYDLFLGLFLYYRFVAYNAAVKRRILGALDPSLLTSSLGGPPDNAHSALRRLARGAAFAVMRGLRRVDSLFDRYRGCQVIEVTLEKPIDRAL